MSRVRFPLPAPKQNEMILLSQHGEAKSETEDKTRPLTEKGRLDVEKVANFLSQKGLILDRIFHSGKRRAFETAEIFARSLKPKEGILEVSGIDPLDEPELVLPKIEQLEGNTLVVGHLPHLSRLLSLMITGSKDREVLKFRMGGVVALDRIQNGWVILWAITPDLF